jgi:hypothetical protein|tara:strand:+ start:376 stop:588 length:213 start_codon:yes stop_codon:yes gene_type:complete
MSQTKKQSIIEVIANTVVGFIISVGVSVLLFPLMGIPVTFGENLGITLIFTVISLVRSFVMRRIFNKIHK